MPTESRHEWVMLPQAMSMAYVQLQRCAVEHHELRPTVITGLPPLDAALGPMQAGDLILVVGGDPGLRLSFLLRCAMGRSERSLVAVLCLEHPSSRASYMMLAADAGVPLSLLDRGQLDRVRHWPAVADSVERHHQRRMALLDLASPTPQAIRAALLELEREHGDITLLVIDAVEPIQPVGGVQLAALSLLARELGALVLAGAVPATAQAARAAGMPSAAIHLPEVGDEALSALGPSTVPVRVAADRAGGSTAVRLDYDPLCCAWSVPAPGSASPGPASRAVPQPPVSRREGKEFDAVYSAACCALLHEVGLAHYWDGLPHGPGRAWELSQDDRLSDEQRLVVRVVLDIWDNQGGVLLRDLRKLPAGMVADVGELIADTASFRGPASWVERHLGEDWQHWMAQGRWEELLGAGWRELLGRDAEQAPC